MNKDIVGSIKNVVLDGITFNAAVDADISEVGGAWENSAIAGSGRNMRKMVKRIETRESVTLLANGAERDQLKALSERTDDITMSYTTAAGDVYRASGWIEFANRTTQEGRAEISMFPRTTWESFLA